MGSSLCLLTVEITRYDIFSLSPFDGRSGTMIAAILLLRQFRKNLHLIDVVGTVLALRKYRANVVLTKIKLRDFERFIWVGIPFPVLNSQFFLVNVIYETVYRVSADSSELGLI